MLKKLLLSLRYYDWWLFTFVLILITFGILIIYSIGINSDPLDLSRFYKQVTFALIGLVIMGVISVTDYRTFNTYAYILYIVGFLSLVFVLIFGTTIRGTTGWFSLGMVSFQPVELAKIMLLAFLARFFSQKSFSMNKTGNIILSAIYTALYVFLVILQPDIGSALIFIALWLGFLLLSHVKKSQLMILTLILAILVTASWFVLLKDYQKERIITFFHPSSDSLHRGYNVIQSTVAIGSGKLIGRGLGLGPQSQLNFLPEQEADFIFAVIAEEFGFIGAFIIILLFSLIFYRIWRLIHKIHNDFSLYLTCGILIILFTQTIINIGMNIGLMPVTGLPLPWVSAGGSSLVINMLLLGIVENIHQKIKFDINR